MNTRVRPFLTRMLLLSALACGLAALYYKLSVDSVIFESMESKNAFSEAVFNEVRLVTSKKTDTWYMRQSQNGSSHPKNQWDSLAIVVNKTSVPKTAVFYQLDSQAKEFKPINYKVKCFICHPNGPRAIRPNAVSSYFQLSYKEKIQVLKWNLKIKLYGRVLPESYSTNDQIKFTSARLNEPLKVGLCTFCHRESGLLARGSLTRQNFLPISFLTTNKLMPPFGIPLTGSARRELKEFVNLF